MNTQFITKTISPSSNLAKMRTPLEMWFYNLLNAIIVGIGSGISTVVVMPVAGLIDKGVPPLNFDTIWSVALCGAIAKVGIFFMQGLPKLNDNSDDQPQSNNQNQP